MKGENIIVWYIGGTPIITKNGTEFLINVLTYFSY